MRVERADRWEGGRRRTVRGRARELRELSSNPSPSPSRTCRHIQDVRGREGGADAANIDGGGGRHLVFLCVSREREACARVGCVGVHTQAGGCCVCACALERASERNRGATDRVWERRGGREKRASAAGVAARSLALLLLSLHTSLGLAKGV